MIHSLASLCMLIVLLMHTHVLAAPPVTAATFAPDGQRLVIGSQAGIEIRSWPELKSLSVVKTELEHVHDLAFSPDGKILLAAGGSPAEEGTVEVIACPEGTLIRRISEHTDLVYRVAWSPDGTQWATAGADGICQVFDQKSGQQLVRYAGHSRAVLAIRYLPDGKSIVSAGVDHTLRIWNNVSGQHLRTLDNHVGTVNDIAIRPMASEDHDGSSVPSIVASASEDRTVRLWQPSIGRLMRFTRLPSIPRVVAWSKQGDRLLVGCNDGHLRILDPETMEIVSDKPVLQGRVHVLITTPTTPDVLVAGESGEFKRQ